MSLRPTLPPHNVKLAFSLLILLILFKLLKVRGIRTPILLNTNDDNTRLPALHCRLRAHYHHCHS